MLLTKQGYLAKASNWKNLTSKYKMLKKLFERKTALNKFCLLPHWYEETFPLFANCLTNTVAPRLLPP